MTEIKNIYEYTVTGEFLIGGSVKADEDSKEVKKFNLKIVCEQTPLSEIVQAMAANKKIVWQSKARTIFNTIKDGDTITIPFKGGRTPVDSTAKAKSIIAGEIANKTPEEKLAWLKANGLL